MHAPPFGMLVEDFSPPLPQVVENAEEVAKQECLVENIYSREVFEEYWHRCAEAKGKARSSGVIPEVFLDKVLGERQCDTDALREGVVEQITHYLSLSPQKRLRWMSSKLQTVVLEDMSHPAYRRFKGLYEPLGLRSKERAQQYKKDLPGWTLLGEYTGVWDSQDKGTQRTNDDAMGLGTMRRDKVTALGYTSGEASEDVQKGLRVGWRVRLELDSSRAQNRLCLINDCGKVPGYDDEPNVEWLECEDSRTLQPHMFLFTVCDVKKGQEALLDYGPEYHRTMEDDLKRAAIIVVERQQRQGAEAALKEALLKHQAKEHDMQEQVLSAQASLRKEREEKGSLKSEIARLQQQLTRQAEILIRQGQEITALQKAIFAPLLPESLAGACQTAEKGATAAAPIAMCGKAVVHVISDDEEEEASKAHDKERAVLEADMEQEEEDRDSLRTDHTRLNRDLCLARDSLKRTWPCFRHLQDRMRTVLGTSLHSLRMIESLQKQREMLEGSVAELQGVVKLLRSQGQGAGKGEAKVRVLEARPGDVFKIMGVKNVRDTITGGLTWDLSSRQQE